MDKDAHGKSEDTPNPPECPPVFRHFHMNKVTLAIVTLQKYTIKVHFCRTRRVESDDIIACGHEIVGQLQIPWVADLPRSAGIVINYPNTFWHCLGKNVRLLESVDKLHDSRIFVLCYGRANRQA